MAVRKYEIKSGSIDASGNASNSTEVSVRGKILKVEVNYPANSCTVDLTAKGEVDEKFLNLAASSTDTTVYPRRQVDDATGSSISATYDHYVVYGKILLEIASGTQGDKVTVTVMTEDV